MIETARESDIHVVSTEPLPDEPARLVTHSARVESTVVILAAELWMDLAATEALLKSLRQEKRKVFVEVSTIAQAKIAKSKKAAGIILSNICGGPFFEVEEAEELIAATSNLKIPLVVRIKNADLEKPFPAVDGVVIDLLETPVEAFQTRLGEKEITVLGTSHASKESAKTVKFVVEALSPETLCVELPPEGTELDVNLADAVKSSSAMMFATLINFANYQERMAQNVGSPLGADMQSAIDTAGEIGAEVVHIDRHPEVTLSRIWWASPFWQRALLFLTSLTLRWRKLPDENSIEALKIEPNLESVTQRFAKVLPAAKRVLIDERDLHMAQAIRDVDTDSLVAVVGLGHLKGIRNALKSGEEPESAEAISPSPLVPFYLRPGALVGLLTSRLTKHPTPLTLIGLFIIDVAVIAFGFALVIYWLFIV